MMNNKKENLEKIKSEYKLFLMFYFKFHYEIKLSGLNAYVNTLINSLMAVHGGEVTKLMINMPPRLGKTSLGTIHFIAWCLGVNPKCRFLVISSGLDLSKMMTGKVLEILDSPIYKYLFPKTKVDKRYKAKNFFKTTQGGQVMGMGAKGQVTGNSAGGEMGSKGFQGAIIIDDILQATEVDTIDRVKKNTWYYDAIFSRRNMINTPIIIIGQRLHWQDIFGYILSNEKEAQKWHKVEFKAIKEDGQALMPEKMNLEELEILKEMRPRTFETQYMQNVDIFQDQKIFLRENIIQLQEKPKTIYNSFVTTDFAITEKTTSDYTCFCHFYIFDNDGEESLYLNKIYLERRTPVESGKALVKFLEEIWNADPYKFNYVVFEDVSSTTIFRSYVTQDLTLLNEHRVKNHLDKIYFKEIVAKRDKSKIDRMLQVSSFFNLKKFYVPHDITHLNQIVYQLIEINSETIDEMNDDIVDCIVDAYYFTFIDHGILQNTTKKAQKNYLDDLMDIYYKQSF